MTTASRDASRVATTDRDLAADLVLGMGIREASALLRIGATVAEAASLIEARLRSAERILGCSRGAA